MSVMTSDLGTDDHAIILFDGVCNFCDASVNFVIKHDKRGYFRFAPLQEPKGAEIARRYGIDPERLDTFVLVENGRAYRKSGGALRVARRLGGLVLARVRAHRRPAVRPRLLLRLVRPPPLPLVRQEGRLHGADAGGARAFSDESDTPYTPTHYGTRQIALAPLQPRDPSLTRLATHA